jgi:type 1 glutamine amidotransferase
MNAVKNKAKIKFLTHKIIEMTAHDKRKTLIVTIILVLAFIANNVSAGAKELIKQMSHEVNYINKKPLIVFLISEDTNNYEAHKTVPVFAEMLQKEHGYDVSVLLGTGGHGSYRYPSLDVLSKADLLVVFARRLALPHEQMNAIKNYLSKGKPLIGIRTAHHAFSVLDKVEEGYENWPAFTSDFLGCENRGYGPADLGYDVSIVSEAANHPILEEIQPQQWHVEGGLYHVALLDRDATVLLRGKLNDKIEPVAWTRTAGKSRVFYTSLGHSSDFKTPQFITLLLNGIKWTLDKKNKD